MAHPVSMTVAAQRREFRTSADRRRLWDAPTGTAESDKRKAL